MNEADDITGSSLLESGFWRIQLVRLANAIAIGAAAYFLFLFLYPDRIAFAAMGGGILGVTLSFRPHDWQADRIFPWRRIGLCLAILNGLAVLFGLLAAFLNAVAGPLNEVWGFWAAFGMAGVGMSFGAIPVVTLMARQPGMPRRPGHTLSRLRQPMSRSGHAHPRVRGPQWFRGRRCRLSAGPPRAEIP